ncbi:unnamed protein product [Knipowitschia caucasica]|uniref:SH2 domain-containing protein n=1 Tax=Knipowitschia caucasica TaxID=637954 RepID=A0AAV2MKE5_KNICA
MPKSELGKDVNRTQWRQKQRSGNQTYPLEPYYDTVDDQEPVHNVHLQPARPTHHEREYADRDLPRSSSAQSLSSDLTTNNSTNHTTYPPRKTSTKPAPIINRALKPGRKKHSAANISLTMNQHAGPPSRRCSPSPHFPSELVMQLNEMVLQESPRRLQQNTTTHVSEFSSNCLDPHNERTRVIFDLEAKHIAKRWSNEELDSDVTEGDHHQYPPTRDNFVSMGESQTHKDDGWNIGSCSRTDAEHALHLVNKDGAFLVRDCSLGSSSEPLVLSVYHEKKVYNVKIRYIESLCKFALGTGQRYNEMFDSVSGIIKFHSIYPIALICAKQAPGSRSPDNCVLTIPVTREDVDRLLQ